MYEYESDIDISKPLDPEQASYFQSLIVVMRWMIEIFLLKFQPKSQWYSRFLPALKKYIL